MFGKILGKGGFCTVSEVSKVLPAAEGADGAAEDMSAMSLYQEESPFIGFQTKRFIQLRYNRQGEARYAVKKVTDGAFNKGDPQFFISSIVDLAMEVKFLAVLRHNHIIKMRGLADVQHSSPDFFIMMDSLTETLSSRLPRWKKEHDKPLLKKAAMEEYYLDRLSIAYDICSALYFLHEHKIMYRDMVSSIVVCL